MNEKLLQILGLKSIKSASSPFLKFKIVMVIVQKKKIVMLWTNDNNDVK
jgi:hypothetical protein